MSTPSSFVAQADVCAILHDGADREEAAKARRCKNLPGWHNFRYHQFMKSKSRKRLSRGRPRIGATPVQVRMPPTDLAALDHWIGKAVNPLTRPEAIRLLVKRGIAARPARSRSKKSASKASDMAAQAIDRLVDRSAPTKEREARKRRLVKGPKEFRDIRSDLPKAK